MRVLGIDFGTKRIGLAVADTALPVAVAKGEIENKRKSSLFKIQDLCKKDEIKLIIIGLPLTLRGEEGEMTKLTRAFGEDIKRLTDIPAEYIDERFTTQKNINSPDAAAAVQILQIWLDRQAR